MKRYKVVLGYRDEKGDLSYKVSSVRGEPFELDDRLFVYYKKKMALLVDIKSGRIVNEEATLNDLMRKWLITGKLTYNIVIKTPRYKEMCRILEVK